MKREEKKKGGETVYRLGDQTIKEKKVSAPTGTRFGLQRISTFQMS